MFPFAGAWVAIATAILLISNRYFIFFNTMVAPYSLSFLLTALSMCAFERAMRFSARPSDKYWAVGVGAFSILAHLTALLPLSICFYLYLREKKPWKNMIFLGFSAVIAALAVLPKGFMIYQLRFVERRSPRAWESLEWGELAGAFFQLFGSFSKAISLPYVIFVGLVILFACIRTDRGNSFYLRLLRLYAVFGILSFVVFKLFGLHEIEARYYFHILPLVYYKLAENLSVSRLRQTALVTLLLFSGVLYFQHRHESYRPMYSAAALLSERLRSGDQVCSPKEVRYAFHIRNVFLHYMKEKFIDGLPAESYFDCHDKFRLNEGMENPRIWIFSQEEFSPEFQCSSRILREDCGSEYYARILKNYRLVERIVVSKELHDDLHLTLYERNSINGGGGE